MDFRSILEGAKIEKIERIDFDISITEKTPINIHLENVDNLIEICKNFDLPIPTRELFEDESQIDLLIKFLEELSEKLLNYGIKLPKLEINENMVLETKKLQEDIDRMEIEIAHMERDYEIFNELRNEICKIQNKDSTASTDLISTSTTYDVNNKLISNVFSDYNIHSNFEKNLPNNFSENLDVNLLKFYIKTLESNLNNMMDSPYYRHKNILLNIKSQYFSNHSSYKSYKNLSKKKYLIQQIQNKPDSFFKFLFSELIEKRILNLSDIQNRYGIDSTKLFKIIYMLESKKIIMIDRENDCIKIYHS